MKHSRRNAVIVMDLIEIAGTALTLVENLYLIAFGRLIVGFSLGMAVVLAPKYIEETCPLALKGSLGALT